MKYLLSLLGICLLPIFNYAQSVANTKPKEEALRRCTGSAYCSACRNCSRCGHCGSGGTCGVCTPSSSSYDYPVKKKASGEKKARSSGYTTRGGNNKTSSVYNNPTSTQTPNQDIYVETDQLSLRSGPGTTYPVIEKLKRNQRVSLISRHGQWTKVKVASSGNIGYCSTAYLRRQIR